jgi:chromosome segregation ATPase
MYSVLFSLVFLCANFVTQISQAEVTNTISDKRNSLIQSLEKRILELTKDSSQLTKLQAAHEKFINLEDELGITELKKKIGDLRQKSCQKQQTDKTIKPYREELDQLTNQVSSQTQPEKKELAQLANMQKQYSSETPEFKALQKKIQQVKERAHRKTADLTKQQKALNKKIQALMRTEIDAAKPFIKELQQKYSKNKKAINNLLDELDQATSAMKKKLVKDKQLREIRKKLHALNRDIMQQEPCLLASATERSWVYLLL